MKTLLLALLFCVSLGAQTFSYYVDSSNGAVPSSKLQSLTSLYAFPDTPVGSASSLVVRVVNTGSTQANLDIIYIGNTSGSPAANPNFTVTGFQSSSVIAPGGFKLFTLNFTPASIGNSYGYLQASNGSSNFAISTLVGNGLTPQLTLSCSSSLAPQCSGKTLQPVSQSIINFGTTSTTTSLSIPFKLTNNSTTEVNPSSLLKIQTTTTNPNSSFSLSPLPSTLSPGSDLDFFLIFAPGTATTYGTNLLLGSISYPIQATGTASVVGDIGSVLISYTDPQGVRLTAQPSSTINFGSAVVGGANLTTYIFTISNPSITIDPVSVPDLTVTGSGFSLTSVPGLPASIAPGASLTFKVVFTPLTAGTYTGVLTIGSRQFSLAATGTLSAVPEPSFQVDINPLVSQKQAHLSISLASASPISTIGTLTMSFTPAVEIIKADPSILFVSTSGRQLGVAIAKGSQIFTANGQSPITFQTGTTAGDLKFTLDFADGKSYSRTYSVTPAMITIDSATATSEPPYLVVNMTGYDNTYSAGKMSFTFYDSAGVALMAKPLPVDATTEFRNFFFDSGNQTGGAFALQLRFPIVGDITRITNMGIVMTNSAGSANIAQNSAK